MKSLIAVVTGFCVLLAAAALPSAQAQVPGGWSKASVKDKGVVQAAQFAVKAQQQAMKADGKGGKIALVTILSAQHQVVAGSNYKLTLRVKAGGTVKTAEAEVWVQLWLKDDEQYKLTSWKFTDDKDPKPVGGRAIHLKLTDSGATVSASVGDLVIIDLEANPSTGYSWEAKPAADKTILELKSKEFLTLAQLNPELQPAPGQGGITTFTYRVTDTGKAAISLVYRRPREKDAKPEKTFGVEIEGTKTTSPAITGRIVFSEEPDVKKISRIEVSIRKTALADGPSPLIGTVELKPPFKLPITFAVPYDPTKIQPDPMFYSISARVFTIVDGSEKLYYINDTHHPVFRDANDTRCDVAVKKLR